MREADQVAGRVGMRVLRRVAHAGLRGEVHDPLRLERSEGGLDRGTVAKVNLTWCSRVREQRRSRACFSETS